MVQCPVMSALQDHHVVCSVAPEAFAMSSTVGRSAAACARGCPMAWCEEASKHTVYMQSGVSNKADLFLNDICPSIVYNESTFLHHLQLPFPVEQPMQLLMIWHTHTCCNGMMWRSHMYTCHTCTHVDIKTSEHYCWKQLQQQCRSRRHV